MYPLIIILIVEHQKSVIDSFQATISNSIHFASAPYPNERRNNTISLIEGIKTHMQMRLSDLEDGLDIESTGSEVVRPDIELKVN